MPALTGPELEQRYRELFDGAPLRSEEHTSELQSLTSLVCRLLLEKKKLQEASRLPRRNPDGALTDGWTAMRARLWRDINEAYSDRLPVPADTPRNTHSEVDRTTVQ